MGISAVAIIVLVLFISALCFVGYWALYYFVQVLPAEKEQQKQDIAVRFHCDMEDEDPLIHANHIVLELNGLQLTDDVKNAPSAPRPSGTPGLDPAAFSHHLESRLEGAIGGNYEGDVGETSIVVHSRRAGNDGHGRPLASSVDDDEDDIAKMKAMAARDYSSVSSITEAGTPIAQSFQERQSGAVRKSKLVLVSKCNEGSDNDLSCADLHHSRAFRDDQLAVELASVVASRSRARTQHWKAALSTSVPSSLMYVEPAAFNAVTSSLVEIEDEELVSKSPPVHEVVSKPRHEPEGQEHLQDHDPWNIGDEFGVVHVRVIDCDAQASGVMSMPDRLEIPDVHRKDSGYLNVRDDESDESDGELHRADTLSVANRGDAMGNRRQLRRSSSYEVNQ